VNTDDIAAAPPSPWKPEADPVNLAILGKLSEELGELSGIVSRCIIQGIDGREPRSDVANRAALQDEIADVAACIMIAVERFGRVDWLHRLSGQMPEPSEAEGGVGLWMVSLAASRASPIRLPESGLARKTSAICGQWPGASSSSPARGGSSSKTSAACSPAAEPNVFGETFADWALRLRADCLRRQKSVRRMNASDYSSSASPISLANQPDASNWPTPATPATRDHKGVDRQDVDRGNARPLNEVASKWPTPTANMITDPSNVGREGSDNLQTATALWSTPMAADARGSAGVGKTELPNQATMRSTPRASDGEKGGPNQSFGAGGIPLPAQTAQWSTPSVADVTGGRMARSGGRSGEPLLNGQAKSLSSRQDLTTYRVGGIPSQDRRALNPLFVEWLMGWPPGWTLAAWTGFACSETALSRWKRDMGFALSQLSSAPVPVVQLSLFG
jgi:hypothetical protein